MTNKTAMAFLIIRSFVSCRSSPVVQDLLYARLHCKSHGHSRLRLVLLPQSALLLSRLALQPPKLLHPRERKLRVGVAVTLLYNLSIQQGAILQEHISKRAPVTVLVPSCRIRLVKLQPHPL